MKEERDLNEVVNKIKNAEKGISDIIVPMLKDSIEDYKKTFTKMFILIILLITVVAGTVGFSLYLVYKQNVKYQEFLSQFEFSSDIYQDTDDNSIINSGITVNK